MDQSFTPALGHSGDTADYDRAIARWTRERAWRGALFQQVAPRSGERILDVGCGTGSFAIMLKRARPDAEIVGLDPDPAVLELARQKAAAAEVSIDWRQGFATDAGQRDLEGFDKCVSSLMFHQMPLSQKERGLAAMAASVRSGGELHVADYARQRGLMRFLFSQTVQRIDGREDTQPNADGALEAMLDGIDPSAGQPRRTFRTPSGMISVFMAKRVTS